MTPPDREKQLESLLDRTLRDLPPRPAPRTLEARVHDELQRRAAQPWWRRSFMQWPLLTRAVFLATCSGVAVLTILEGTWSFARAHSWLEAGTFPGTVFPDMAFPFAWARATLTVAASTSDLASRLAGAIPATWVYGGLTLGAILYATLFGLGATAYRALYLPPLNDR
jgi:lysylphosphatidylglycerol synthetase-like protein (DUF2156 family)